MKNIFESKAPILLSAGLSMAFSVYLWFYVSKEFGLFVAIWVPTIMSFGTFMRGPN
jgi:hypothetical protein